ncbi:MFS transporter [Flexivirga oryzae]|uniref:MFS family permease n=1 Tax=Flexivirga oryzae TaxID=1794944 RepID=A0A839NEM5_9MICO|nr:MFS transporter [Flexivirga oryzae]MBB2893605.1 MFS family permease [Flexivirga oryzae]
MATATDLRPERVGSRFGLWVVTAVLGLFLFAAGAPTPLYGMYAARWGFTPATLTVIFAVYAVALLATLLVTGSLSDAVGRRPVILAALALQSLSMVAFLVADGLGWLFVARIGQGVATGLVTAAVAAALIDHQPANRPGLGPLLNAVTPMLGLAFGSLVAGALVQYAPHPLRLVYALMLAGFVLLAVAMLRVPESVAERRPVDLHPRIGVAPETRAMFWVALPCIVACWALGGLFLSLGPSLIRQLGHSTNHLLGGATAFALCAAGALAGVLVRGWTSHRAMLTGCALLVAGLVIAVTAITTAHVVLLLVGSVVAGAGFGAAFLGAFRTLVVAADPARRGELIAALYVVAYLAFSLPAVVAGLLTTRVGLRATSVGYAVVVAMLAACSIAAAARRQRRTG